MARVALLLFGLFVAVAAIHGGRRLASFLGETRRHLGEDARTALARQRGGAYMTALSRVEDALGPHEPYFLVEGTRDEFQHYWVRFDLAPRRAIWAGRLTDQKPHEVLLNADPASPSWVVVALTTGAGPGLISTRRFAPSAGPVGVEDPKLFGSVDAPSEDVEISGNLRVRGWARKEGEDLGVVFLIGGWLREPVSQGRIARPDVCRVFPAYRQCDAAGYEATLPFLPGDAGVRELTAVFTSRDGRVRHFPARRFRWSP